MKGFFFNTPKKEYFFVTDKTKKTKCLIEKIDNILKEKYNCTYRGTFGTFPLADMLHLGECEIKECSHGKYYNIYGEGWGGFGHFLHENKTEIIYLE